MTFPITATLQIKHRDPGAKDAHGNPVVAYGDPVDWPVHGYGPGANELGAASNRDLSYILWTVYAPATDVRPNEMDLVTLGGEDYLVDGRPSDYSQGPFDFADAGISVMLKAAEG